jgi:hypothetical protein
MNIVIISLINMHDIIFIIIPIIRFEKKNQIF